MYPGTRLCTALTNFACLHSDISLPRHCSTHGVRKLRDPLASVLHRPYRHSMNGKRGRIITPLVSYDA